MKNEIRRIFLTLLFSILSFNIPSLLFAEKPHDAKPAPAVRQEAHFDRKDEFKGERGAQAFERADRNDDGRVGPRERMMAREQFGRSFSGQPPVQPAAFESGSPAQGPMGNFNQGGFGDRKEALFDRADRNDDGFLGPGERNAMREHRQERREEWQEDRREDRMEARREERREDRREERMEARREEGREDHRENRQEDRREDRREDRADRGEHAEPQGKQGGFERMTQGGGPGAGARPGARPGPGAGAGAGAGQKPGRR